MQSEFVEGRDAAAGAEPQGVKGPGSLDGAVMLALQLLKSKGSGGGAEKGLGAPSEGFQQVCEAVDTKLGGAALWRDIFRRKVRSVMMLAGQRLGDDARSRAAAAAR